MYKWDIVFLTSLQKSVPILIVDIDLGHVCVATFLQNSLRLQRIWVQKFVT